MSDSKKPLYKYHTGYLGDVGDVQKFFVMNRGPYAEIITQAGPEFNLEKIFKEEKVPYITTGTGVLRYIICVKDLGKFNMKSYSIREIKKYEPILRPYFE